MKKNAYLSEMINDWNDGAELTRGEQLVLNEYYRSMQEGYPQLVINSICWEQDRDQIIETLRASGLKSFIFADTSSASMETLFDFTTAGFKVSAPIKYNKANPTEWDKDRIGLVIKIK